MKVVVIGTGYVGLVTGVCLAEIGHTVINVDTNDAIIQNLRNGIPHIYENDLDEVLNRNLNKNRISFESDLRKCIDDIDFIFIAVGTPENKESGRANLQYLYSAIDEINSLFSGSGKQVTVVIKSTVPVGTNAKIQKMVNNTCENCKLDIVSNPEFLREGRALEDCLTPDRIVIGASDRGITQKLKELYSPLISRNIPVLETDNTSAELIKYASNAFLATKVAFINELSQLARKSGASISDVSDGMGLDARIGRQFLNSGPGYGGSCFPKDTLELAGSGADFEVELKITNATIRANIAMKDYCVDLILSKIQDIPMPKVAVFGVAFKSNTDDVREAPALHIIPRLIDAGVVVTAYDPQANDNGKEALRSYDLTWVTNPQAAVDGVDAVIILTEWDEFLTLDLRKLSTSMRNKCMIDLRNIYDKNKVLSEGFDEFISLAAD